MKIFRQPFGLVPTFSLAARRSVLATAALGLILVASFVLAPGAVHAASTQAHRARIANSISGTNDCSAHNTSDVVIVTDGGWDVDCFSGSGSASIGLYDVTALETGDYQLTFTWQDYGGGSYTSNDVQGSFLSSANADFAGYGSIAKITSIQLQYGSYVGVTTCPTQDNSSSGDDTVRMAMHVPGSFYYTDCFDIYSNSSVKLYGVYAIETGDYTLSFNWQDYNGATHSSAIEPYTLLAAGNASSGGFAGASSIALITSIRLYRH